MIVVSLKLNSKIKELEKNILFKDSLINKIDSIKFDIEYIKRKNNIDRVIYEKNKEHITAPIPTVEDSILLSKLRDFERRFYNIEKTNSLQSVDNK